MLFGKEHVERYRATDGEEGHLWQGALTLLLTQGNTDREIQVVVLEPIEPG